MTALLLAPHNDDETLFAAFTIIREKPFVVVCTKSAKQAAFGITAEERERETGSALVYLGAPSREFWSFPDNHLEEYASMVRSKLRRLTDRYDRVYAPAVEEGGHEDHNLIGEAALDAFGPERTTGYLTYRRGYSKSVGVEVVPEPGWIVAKLRALACYESQIREPSTRAWFMGDIREYYSEGSRI